MEIYRGPLGDPLRRVFTFVIPVLLAVNVPARLLIRPLLPADAAGLAPAAAGRAGRGGEPAGVALDIPEVLGQLPHAQAS